MKIAQLKQAIADLPDDMDVFIGERLTEESVGLVNSARVQKISVSDEETEEITEYRTVLILSEV